MVISGACAPVPVHAVSAAHSVIMITSVHFIASSEGWWDSIAAGMPEEVFNGETSSFGRERFHGGSKAILRRMLPGWRMPGALRSLAAATFLPDRLPAKIPQNKQSFD